MAALQPHQGRMVKDDVTMKITRLGNTFAALAGGVDVRHPLCAAEVDAIEHALAQEGVLVFRAMPMNDGQQQALIERFGPPSEVKLEELKTAKSAHPHFFDVSTETMDLVDEQDIAFAETREDCREVSGSVECGTRGHMEANLEFGSDDAGQSCFSEPWRTSE